MTLWSFLDVHPWWALVYLLVVCATALGAAQEFGRKKR